MAYVVERNGWMYIAYPDPSAPNGERRTSLKTRDREAAEETVKDYNAAERMDLLGVPGKNKKQNPLLTELFDQFLVYSKKHKHKNTVVADTIYIEKFLRPTFGHIRIRELNDDHVEDFVAALKNWTVINKKGEIEPAPYHPETINKRLKCLRQVLNRAARPGPNSIPVPIDISKHLVRLPKPLPKYVTPDEFAIWIRHVNKPINRYRAVMELCTSIPDSELAKLRWDRNYRQSPESLRYWRGKNKREIIVALNAWAREVMEELKKIKDGPKIFHGVKDAKSAYLVASKNSGIKVTPHMLRHSFGTWALSGGASLAYIQQVMGHADQSTTQIYAKVLPQFFAEATNAVDRMRPPGTMLPAPEKAVSQANPVQHENKKGRSKN